MALHIEKYINKIKSPEMGLERWLSSLLPLQRTQVWDLSTHIADHTQPPIMSVSGNLISFSGLHWMLHVCDAHKLTQPHRHI